MFIISFYTRWFKKALGNRTRSVKLTSRTCCNFLLNELKKNQIFKCNSQQGRAVKRARQKFGSHYESEEVKLAPHSMVIPRGPVDKSVKELIQDVRRVMLPFTAAELRATKKNSLKDFVSIAGPLHVSHLLIFSQTELGENMKIIRMPRGPSLHFKLVDFSLTNDVLNAQKKRHTHQKQFLHQPLLILNGFSAGIKQPAAENKDEPKPEFHLKLLAATLQNMFPTINITKVFFLKIFNLH